MVSAVSYLHMQLIHTTQSSSQFQIKLNYMYDAGDVDSSVRGGGKEWDWSKRELRSRERIVIKLVYLELMEDCVSLVEFNEF